MRYLRLYLYFLQFSFTKALQFRLEFTFRIFMDFSYHLLTIFFFQTLYQHTDLISSWNESQMMLFVAGLILNDAIYMTFFSTNSWWLPIHINKGELDYYLTKPVSPLFFLSLKEFAANSFINLFFAMGIFIWALAPLWDTLSALQIFVYFILIINGAVLWYLFHLLFYIPVFWTQSPRGFETLLWGLDNIVKYPHLVQKSLFRFFFTFILPLNLMVSYPASFLFSASPSKTLITIICISISTWMITLYLWEKGLRQYSSASS